MAKEEIRKILNDAISSLEKDYDGFVKSIKKDLESFKKQTLEKI